MNINSCCGNANSKYSCQILKDINKWFLFLGSFDIYSLLGISFSLNNISIIFQSNFINLLNTPHLNICRKFNFNHFQFTPSNMRIYLSYPKLCLPKSSFLFWMAKTFPYKNVIHIPDQWLDYYSKIPLQ